MSLWPNFCARYFLVESTDTWSQSNYKKCTNNETWWYFLVECLKSGVLVSQHTPCPRHEVEIWTVGAKSSASIQERPTFSVLLITAILHYKNNLRCAYTNIYIEKHQLCLATICHVYSTDTQLFSWVYNDWIVGKWMSFFRVEVKATIVFCCPNRGQITANLVHQMRNNFLFNSDSYLKRCGTKILNWRSLFQKLTVWKKCTCVFKIVE